MTWAPKAGVGRHALRIRHEATGRSMGVRRGASTVSSTATPARLAKGKAFVFEVINLNGDKRTIRRKLTVQKPKKK